MKTNKTEVKSPKILEFRNHIVYVSHRDEWHWSYRTLYSSNTVNVWTRKKQSEFSKWDSLHTQYSLFESCIVSLQYSVCMCVCEWWQIYYVYLLLFLDDFVSTLFTHIVPVVVVVYLFFIFRFLFILLAFSF